MFQRSSLGRSSAPANASPGPEAGALCCGEERAGSEVTALSSPVIHVFNQVTGISDADCRLSCTKGRIGPQTPIRNRQRRQRERKTPAGDKSCRKELKLKENKICKQAKAAAPLRPEVRRFAPVGSPAYVGKLGGLT